MGSVQLSSYTLSPLKISQKFNHKIHTIRHGNCNVNALPRLKLQAVGTVPETKTESMEPEEPSGVSLAFVHSVLLPDGTPDVHFRTACGGRKLRDIMLDSNIELYGPYARPLLNCAGRGTCATCMVEVIQGKELLNPRTDKENEKLKRKPKNWRLACQTIVGNPDSTGLVVIQQLPEWKAHEWKYEKILPSEIEEELSQ